MPKPFPHQIEGAKFLARSQGALLADEPRVGKTGAAIMACDMVFAKHILVVTTASGRANWRREFQEWGFARTTAAVYAKADRPDTQVVIVSWSMITDPGLLEHLCRRGWDVLIVDESHYGKTPDAKRTAAVFEALAPKINTVWCLSGTPAANGPHELFTTLAACAPERLEEGSDWPACKTYDRWVDRYCRVQHRKYGNQWVPVVKGGKNLDELKERLRGFALRRTQQDAGIREPIYSLYSLSADAAALTAIRNAVADIGLSAEEVLAAAETGETAGLELHLGVLRRITGTIKAYAVVEALREELSNGLDRIVLMSWHADVLAALEEGLRSFGVVTVSGETPAKKREAAIADFQGGKARVFNGQMQAAGEAIDLSVSANLMFVEGSFNPKDLKQAALRITNHSQTRQCFVRVCVLDGSIDEALGRVVLAKVATNRKLQE